MISLFFFMVYLMGIFSLCANMDGRCVDCVPPVILDMTVVAVILDMTVVAIFASFPAAQRRGLPCEGDLHFVSLYSDMLSPSPSCFSFGSFIFCTF